MTSVASVPGACASMAATSAAAASPAVREEPAATRAAKRALVASSEPREASDKRTKAANGVTVLSAARATDDEPASASGPANGARLRPPPIVIPDGPVPPLMRILSSASVAQSAAALPLRQPLGALPESRMPLPDLAGFVAALREGSVLPSAAALPPSAAVPATAFRAVPPARIFIPQVFSAYNFSGDPAGMLENAPLAPWGSFLLPAEALRHIVSTDQLLMDAEKRGVKDGIAQALGIVDSGIFDRLPAIKKDFMSRLFLQRALDYFPIYNQTLFFGAAPPAPLQEALDYLEVSERDCENADAPVHNFKLFQYDELGVLIGERPFCGNIHLVMRKSVIALLKAYCYLETTPQPTSPLEQCGAHKALHELNRGESFLALVRTVDSRTVQLWIAEFSKSVQSLREQVAKRLHPNSCFNAT